MNTLADRIRASRKTAGLTQRELGRRAGVTSQAVGHWERGKTANLRLDHLFAIANALGVDAKWLALGAGSREWSEPPSSGQISLQALPDPADLAAAARELSAKKQRLLWQLIDALNDNGTNGQATAANE